MSKQWQIRRGTSAENDAFTGAQGEITMDTERKTIRIHDGTTQGGVEVPSDNTADYVVDFQLPTAGNNYTWWRKYKSGWIEQGGYTVANHDSEYTFTLPVAMKDANYTITIGVQSTNTSGCGYAHVGIRNKTATNVTVWCNSKYIQRKYWQVSGIAA